jgi:cytochrome c1
MVCSLAAAAVAAALAILGWTILSQRAEIRAVAIALTKGDPDRAPTLLIRYGCAGCHTIPGVPGANGAVAPPLSGLRARVYVGVLPNTAENLAAWIVNPPASSPQTAMPVTGITEQEARDVAAYLYMQ